MQNNIIANVRLLILVSLLLGATIILVVSVQKIRVQGLTEKSIDYHFYSITYLDAIFREIRLISEHLHFEEHLEKRLEDLPVESFNHHFEEVALNELSHVRFTIDENLKKLRNIQDAFGVEPFGAMLTRMQQTFETYEQLRLFSHETTYKMISIIQRLEAFQLQVEQLERLHRIENEKLIKQRQENLDNDFIVLIATTVLALLFGSVLIYKVMLSIREILQIQQETSDELFDEKERSQTTLTSIGDGVITTDTHGTIEFMNPIAEQLTKWTMEESMGKPVTEIFNIINEETGQPATEIVKRVLRDGVVVGLANHTVLISRDGSKRSIEDSAAPIRDRDGDISGIVIVFHDVTHARRMAEEMTWQASHDALTGLKNRHKFEEVLKNVIEDISENGHQHAFLYLDLDQFKIVNDTSGHVAGDELLKEIAFVIKSQVRDVDTVARLGGDEFGILLASCPIEKAVSIAEQVREAIRDFRFVWEDKSFSLGVSIGLVPVSTAMSKIGDIMRAADIACYAAKDIGRNRVHIYQPDDAELLIREGEMEWVERINVALEQNKFVLYSQNIVPFSAEEQGVKHFEVLLRMVDDDDGLVAPMAFIPAAERYNLMPQIDRWVINNVFEKVEKNNVQNLGFFSINISGQSLGDESFLKFATTRIENSTIQHDKICFEITETAAISNFPQALNFIGALREKGVQFALDDFGSGLSSFGYLKNMKVDYLKIDGTFVRDMLNDEIDHAMVQSINSIGHTMNIKTIAEFVENEELVHYLKAIGVDYGQGYGLARPEPL